MNNFVKRLITATVLFNVSTSYSQSKNIIFPEPTKMIFGNKVLHGEKIDIYISAGDKTLIKKLKAIFNDSLIKPVNRKLKLKTGNISLLFTSPKNIPASITLSAQDKINLQKKWQLHSENY